MEYSPSRDNNELRVSNEQVHVLLARFSVANRSQKSRHNIGNIGG